MQLIRTITRKKVLAIGALLVVAALALGACSAKSQEQFKDSGTGTRDRTPAEVIEMPDGFSNIATKCVGDIRYTVVFHNNDKYGSVSTVVDPACATKP